MDMYKLKFTRLQNEIIRLLCIKVGQSLNQRNISKLLKVSPTAVSKSLLLLEKEGLVKANRSSTMNLVIVELNRDTPAGLGLKRIENIKMLQESGLPNFIEEAFPSCNVILFGSYSLGEDTMKSDIDVAIIGAKKKDLDLSKYEKLLERKINLQFYENLGNIDINLRSNILNGITLAGFVQL